MVLPFLTENDLRLIAAGLEILSPDEESDSERAEELANLFYAEADLRGVPVS